jgi:hypothetical protein
MRQKGRTGLIKIGRSFYSWSLTVMGTGLVFPPMVNPA